jgi:hypothetical protein
MIRRHAILVDGGTKVLCNREQRRDVLARASRLLQVLTSCLKPLVAESAEREPVAEAVDLFDWVAEERGRARVLPRYIGADGARNA